MIIDIHTHCFPDDLAAKAIPLLSKNAGIPYYSDGTLDGLKKSILDSGIGISVVQHIATKPFQTQGINRWAVKIQNESIMSFGTIHPDLPDWKEEIRFLKEAGIRGVKFHPDYQDFFVDEGRVFPIYETLFEAGLVVLFHAGADAAYTEPYHCTPSRLKKVLDSFPGTVIIAAHMGGFRYWDEVEKYLIGRELYLDTSSSYDDLGHEEMERIIKHHGPHRILFGSDSPWTNPSVEISRIESLNLCKDAIKEILSGNASKILGLKD